MDVSLCLQDPVHRCVPLNLHLLLLEINLTSVNCFLSLAVAKAWPHKLLAVTLLEKLGLVCESLLPRQSTWLHKFISIDVRRFDRNTSILDFFLTNVVNGDPPKIFINSELVNLFIPALLPRIFNPLKSLLIALIHELSACHQVCRPIIDQGWQTSRPPRLNCNTFPCLVEIRYTAQVLL